MKKIGPNEIKKKFLTVCEGGNVRSVAMALQLKMTVDQDAIAASWKWNSPETFRMLMEWADYIILMQEVFLDRVPHANEFRHKMRVVEVGEDNYHNPLHMGLNRALKKIVLEWQERNFML